MFFLVKVYLFMALSAKKPCFLFPKVIKWLHSEMEGEKMKKLLSVIMALAIMLTMVACGSKKDESSAPATSESVVETK